MATNNDYAALRKSWNGLWDDYRSLTRAFHALEYDHAALQNEMEAQASVLKGQIKSLQEALDKKRREYQESVEREDLWYEGCELEKARAEKLEAQLAILKAQIAEAPVAKSSHASQAQKQPTVLIGTTGDMDSYRRLRDQYVPIPYGGLR